MPDAKGQAASRPGPDLLSGSVPKAMALFAIPTLGSSVLQSLNGSINAIWVGRFLGEEALAATTNGNIVMFLLISFVFGFGMASTIFIGQAAGRSDEDGARRVMGTALGTIIPMGAAIALIGWFVAPWLLGVLGTPGEARALALTYLRVIFVAMPATLTFTLVMMALRGTGDSITPLKFMGVSAALDVALNPVLILGLGPVPELGIFGSGLATVIANTVALVGIMVSLYRRDSVLALRGRALRLLLPDRTVLRAVVGKGLPIGLQMIVISTASLTMLTLINREGVDTAAAYGATQQLWTYVQMPAMALSAAASAMAAQNIGAGQWGRVGRIARWGIYFNLGLTGLLIALLTVFDRAALGLFLGADSTAIPIGRHIQLVATWGYLFFGIAQVLFGTMRANGYVIAPLIVMVISMYPVRLGFAFGLRPVLGEDALWLSFPIGMTATAAMAAWLYRRGRWREGSAVSRNEAAKGTGADRDCGSVNGTGTDLAPGATVSRHAA
ncbi:putative MATE family efflux protein [Hasllibacter halocynthiae]|uniref:Putative MATE family efflux protein n=1 Tax=Hasllibacter halocynthiae TaxID=595589 RepID=A0A2T0X4D3_9RHOB|nr:MATE family efflux transporter [Hasllibacter halocynthiae]PRY93802.1 putative MATE family efflux protein [Hasllibacter halocynthiae]